MYHHVARPTSPHFISPSPCPPVPPIGHPPQYQDLLSCSQPRHARLPIFSHIGHPTRLESPASPARSRGEMRPTSLATSPAMTMEMQCTGHPGSRQMHLHARHHQTFQRQRTATLSIQTASTTPFVSPHPLASQFPRPSRRLSKQPAAQYVSHIDRIVVTMLGLLPPTIQCLAAWACPPGPASTRHENPNAFSVKKSASCPFTFRLCQCSRSATHDSRSQVGASIPRNKCTFSHTFQRGNENTQQSVPHHPNSSIFCFLLVQPPLLETHLFRLASPPQGRPLGPPHLRLFHSLTPFPKPRILPLSLLPRLPPHFRSSWPRTPSTLPRPLPRPTSSTARSGLSWA